MKKIEKQLQEVGGAVAPRKFRCIWFDRGTPIIIYASHWILVYEPYTITKLPNTRPCENVKTKRGARRKCHGQRYTGGIMCIEGNRKPKSTLQRYRMVLLLRASVERDCLSTVNRNFTTRSDIKYLTLPAAVQVWRPPASTGNQCGLALPWCFQPSRFWASWSCKVTTKQAAASTVPPRPSI